MQKYIINAMLIFSIFNCLAMNQENVSPAARDENGTRVFGYNCEYQRDKLEVKAPSRKHLVPRFRPYQPIKN